VGYDDRETKLEGKIIGSFESKELMNLGKDFTELGLDSLLEDGIIKEIPILRTIVAICKIHMNIRDRLFLKKVVGFLAQIADTNETQREEFVNENCKDKKNFEETVLLILEHADRFEKTALIGKIFKACILKKILYADAITLSEMVNKVFWNDLKTLIELDRCQEEENQRLYFSGLLEMKIKVGRRMAGGDAHIEYQKNIYAVALKEIYQENYENLGRCSIGMRALKST
jgi:hypothetical protein